LGTHSGPFNPGRCSLHKPAQQTVLPASAVPVLLGPLPLARVKGLGGKFGVQVRTYNEIATQP
jgi:nucleotidyltransferase/DNA polymerase involved in DNA repair